MIHNLKDGGVAYRQTTYDDPDDGSMFVKIEVQRDWTLLVDAVAMPHGIAVQLAAMVLRDYLADHPYDGETEGDLGEIMNGALDGLAGSEQLALFDYDETGELIVSAQATGEA